MNESKRFCVRTDEPALIVQIALGAMFLSWPVGIVAAIFWDGYAQDILIWPMIVVAILTISGTPCKSKYVTKEELLKNPHWEVLNGEAV